MSHATKSTPSSAQSMVTVATVSPKIKTTMDEHVVDGEETCEPDETKAHTGQEAHEDILVATKPARSAKKQKLLVEISSGIDFVTQSESLSRSSFNPSLPTTRTRNRI